MKELILNLIQAFIRLLGLMLVLAFLLGAALYYALNSPAFLQKAIPFYLNRLDVNFTVDNFTVGESIFEFPGELLLKNAAFSMVYPDRTLDLTIERTFLEGAHGIIGGKKVFKADIENLDVLSSKIQIKKVDFPVGIYIEEKDLKLIKGTLNIGSFKYKDYLWSDIHATVYGNSNRINFTNLDAHFYGGTLKGNIALDYVPYISYIIRLGIENLEPVRLRSINHAVFSQMRGSLAGIINVVGDDLAVYNIKLLLRMPNGGEVSTSLLKPLMEYIPHSTQKRDLESLIQNNQNLYLDEAKIWLENISDNSLRSNMLIRSRRMNLNADIDMDINIEGGMRNLLNHFKKVSP